MKYYNTSFDAHVQTKRLHEFQQKLLAYQQKICLLEDSEPDDDNYYDWNELAEEESTYTGGERTW